jgi:hypothetical protein
MKSTLPEQTYQALIPRQLKSNGTLPEISQNSFVSPEHKRMAQILVKKENRSRYMKITYLGNCKPSNHLNDTLEASN